MSNHKATNLIVRGLSLFLHTLAGAKAKKDKMFLIKSLLLRHLILWAADTDTGGGGTDPAPPPATTGGEPPATPPAKAEAITFSQEQQVYLDKLIGTARKDGREAAKKEFEVQQQKAKEESEAARLKEQNEWQKLAEQHEGAVKELTPKVETLTAQIAAYETVIVELLDAKIKALGDGAKVAVNALPGSPDSLARLLWLNSNEALFKAQTLGPGNQTKPKPGITTPQGAQQMTPARPIVRL